MAVFVAELRKLSEHCNTRDLLDKALRDRILGGINDEAIRGKLLGERTLTYECAIEIAQGVETKDASLREMKTLHKPVTVKSEPVHRVDRVRGSRTRPPGRMSSLWHGRPCWKRVSIQGQDPVVRRDISLMCADDDCNKRPHKNLRKVH